MPTLSCPACYKLTSRLLDETSEGTAVNYYHCGACGHIWTTDKQTGKIEKHVTPLTRTPPKT